MQRLEPNDVEPIVRDGFWIIEKKNCVCGSYRKALIDIMGAATLKKAWAIAEEALEVGDE